MIETMHEAQRGRSGRATDGRSRFSSLCSMLSQVEDRPSTMKLNGEDVDPQERDADRVDQSGDDAGRGNEVGIEGCLSFPEITGDI